MAPTTPSKRAGTAPKRVKIDAAAERKAAAERAKGLRRSPRKRVVKEVKKFMLESDDDEEDQENEPAAAEAPKEKEEEKVKMVVEETVVVEEETIIPDAPPAPAPAPQESTPEPEAPIAEAQDDDFPLARDERHLVPVLTFNSIDIWHPDYAGDLADDVYARTMSEWVGVSAKVSRAVRDRVHGRMNRVMLTVLYLRRSTLTELQKVGERQLGDEEAASTGELRGRRVVRVSLA